MNTVDKPVLNLSFTDADKRAAFAYVQALAESGAKYAEWCKRVQESDIITDSLSAEDDTLYVGPCILQKVEGETTGIVKRPCVWFSVQVPYTVFSSSHWEPDDMDFKEIATCDSLFDAIRALYLHEAEQYLRDVAMCIDYELDKQVSEEV